MAAMRPPFAIAAWMLLVFVVVTAIAFVISLGPWTDAHGYPLMVGAGAVVYACGALPIALAVTLLLGLFGKLAGTKRSRAGVCPRCGYDVRGLRYEGGSARCPECGGGISRLRHGAVVTCPECGVELAEPECDDRGRSTCPECGVNLFRES